MSQSTDYRENLRHQAGILEATTLPPNPTNFLPQNMGFPTQIFHSSSSHAQTPFVHKRLCFVIILSCYFFCFSPFFDKYAVSMAHQLKVQSNSKLGLRMLGKSSWLNWNYGLINLQLLQVIGFSDWCFIFQFKSSKHLDIFFFFQAGDLMLTSGCWRKHVLVHKHLMLKVLVMLILQRLRMRTRRGKAALGVWDYLLQGILMVQDWMKWNLG